MFLYLSYGLTETLTYVRLKKNNKYVDKLLKNVFLVNDNKHFSCVCYNFMLVLGIKLGVVKLSK